jgi:hypothetical protein
VRSLGRLANDDSNPIGAGTDLMLSLLVLLAILVTITVHAYDEQRRGQEGGDFQVATELFQTAAFLRYPVTGLVNEADTRRRVQNVVAQYRNLGGKYPYVMVIGHASTVAPRQPSSGVSEPLARAQENWLFASRRAAKIASLIAVELEPNERDRLVVTSTGEYDLRDTARPEADANTWVEVVFARDWKPPSSGRSLSLPGAAGQ